MPKVESIVEEMMREGKTTRRLLERVPGDRLDWRPHAKSRTLGALAWHVAVIPARLARLSLSDDADALTLPQPAAPTSTSELVAGFDASLREGAELLGGLDDAALERTLTFRRGETVVFKLPRMAFLRTVLLNHSVHHRGQLSVYLRLLDVPLPSIYGPTADES
jgi:uncharacterized damage-inducible protein DinB